MPTGKRKVNIKQAFLLDEIPVAGQKVIVAIDPKNAEHVLIKDLSVEDE
jgi:hypothetical protein